MEVLHNNFSCRTSPNILISVANKLTGEVYKRAGETDKRINFIDKPACVTNKLPCEVNKHVNEAGKRINFIDKLPCETNKSADELLNP